MNQILDELPIRTRPNYRAYAFYGVLGVCVLVAGIYVGNIFFGKRSVAVMLDLYDKKERLRHEVSKFQEQNAALQKEYFELKGLDPENYKKME